MKTVMQGVMWVVLFGIGLAVHAGTVYLDYTDPQGNVLAVADTQGHILARYDYRPYGGVVSGSGPDGPGYTGHVQDPETGLIYMQARYDDPLGRFPSPDPVGPTPGNVYSFNRYAYANNNPLVNTDPDGRSVLLALAGVLYETGSFVSGHGFHGGRIAGALVDGYNGEGAGVKGAIAQDAGLVLAVATAGIAAPEAAATEGGAEVLGAGVAEAGGEGVTASAAQSATSEAATGTEDFFAGTRYTNKVLGQMKQGDLHAFPESVKAFQGAGKVDKLIGGDGSINSILKIQGGYKGKEGAFEFIKDAYGNINHRFFRPSSVP